MNSRSTFEEQMFLKVLEESKALGRLAKRPWEGSQEYVTSKEMITPCLPSVAKTKTRNACGRAPIRPRRCPNTASLQNLLLVM